jgi:hypothetical protein
MKRVLAMEWTKLRSLRSTVVCLGVVVVAMLTVAIVMGVRWSSELGTASGRGDKLDAANVSLSGLYIAQVVVGALAVLVISSEHTTGMIRATFAAVPRRRSVLLAKLVVVTGVTLVLAELLCFASFGICQALLAHTGRGASLSDPSALRAVVGGGLFLGVVALLGFGLGATLRNTAAALSALFGVLFALTALSDLLPTHLRNDVINYMPLNAGNQIFVTDHNTGALAPWTGLGVFTLYAVVALAGGFLLVNRRDA